MSPSLAQPPLRPPAWEETTSRRLLLLLSPRVARRSSSPPPGRLRPWENVALPRRLGRGSLAATWLPAAGRVRGAVLLAPPWQPWGRAYFHRRGRLEALRAAGYHSLTVDLPNFGGSGPPAGYFDRDLADAGAWLAHRVGDLPLFFWGVSAGGYWAHPWLARNRRVAAAFFEDVSPHPLEWAWRVAPWGRPAYLAFRALFRRGYDFLDARRHARALSLPTTYVCGDMDPGIPVETSRDLARASGGLLRVVEGAGHLEAIKLAPQRIASLALERFEQASDLARVRRLEPLESLAVPPGRVDSALR